MEIFMAYFFTIGISASVGAIAAFIAGHFLTKGDD